MESAITLKSLEQIGQLTGDQWGLALLDPASLHPDTWDSLLSSKTTAIQILPEVLRASARIRNSSAAKGALKTHVSFTCAELIKATVDLVVSKGPSDFPFDLSGIAPESAAAAVGALTDSDLASTLAAILAGVEARTADMGVQIVLLGLAARVASVAGDGACSHKETAPEARKLATHALSVLQLNAASGVDGSASLTSAACDVLCTCGPASGLSSWALADHMVTAAEQTVAQADAHDPASPTSAALFALAATILAALPPLLSQPLSSGHSRSGDKDTDTASDIAQRLRCMVAAAASATQPPPAPGTVAPQENAASIPPGAALIDQWPHAWDSTGGETPSKCSSAVRCSAAASQALVASLKACWKEGREHLVVSAASSLGTHISCGIFLGNATAAAEQQALVLTLGSLGAALLDVFGDPSPEGEKIRRVTLPVINELLSHCSDETVPPEVIKAAALALADLGVVSSHSRTPSLLPVVVDVLCQTWSDPEGTAASRMAVAAGMERLAKGVVSKGFTGGAGQEVLALRLLQTFVESAAFLPSSALPARLTSKIQQSSVQKTTGCLTVADLVSLLPAIAHALGNGNAAKVLPLCREIRALVNKGWKGEIYIAPRVEEADAAFQIKVFRLFWIYAAVLNVEAHAAHWLQLIASGTPPLLSVPGPKLRELELEVEERLLQLFLGPGTAGASPSSRASREGADLPKYMLALSKGARGGDTARVRDTIAKELTKEALLYSPAMSSDKVAPSSLGLGALAIQLATMKVARCRTAAGLTDPDFTPVHAAYAYMAVAQARDAPFLKVLADSAFDHTLSNILDVKAASGVDLQATLRNLAQLIIGHLQQPQWGEHSPELIALTNPGPEHTVSSNNIAALEAISRLRSSPEATAAATRPGKIGPLEMIRMSESFLGLLMARCPSILYDPTCLRAMLNALAVEQSKSQGGPKSQHQPGAVMPWLRVWLREASRSAPKVLEASLHAALGSGLSGPISPFLHHQQPGGPRAALTQQHHHLSQVSMVLEAASQSMAGVLVQEVNAVSLRSVPLMWARGGIEKHHRRATGPIAPTKDDRDASGSPGGGKNKAKNEAFSSLARTLQAETVSLLSLRSQVLGEAAGLKIGLTAGTRTDDETAATAVTRRLLVQSSEASPEETDRKAAESLGRSALLGCALLAETPLEAVLEAPSVSQLLSAVVWAPVQSGSPAATAQAALGWHWIVAAHLDAAQYLATEVARAFLWTCRQGWGLYSSDTSLPPADFGPDGDVSTLGKVGKVLRQVRLQKELVGFLGEIVASKGLGGDDGAAVILDTVLDAASTALAGLLPPGSGEPEPLPFGRHPAALGLRLLVLNLAAQCGAAKSLRSKSRGLVPQTHAAVAQRTEAAAHWDAFAAPLLDSGLMTFARASAVLSHWTSQEAREELELPMLSIKALSHMLRLPDPVVATATAAKSAPVALSNRVSLLSFLCVMESDRKTVFFDPVKALELKPADYLQVLEDSSLRCTHVPLKANHATDAQWAAWASTAWQVDPRLAMTLAQRFPAAQPLCKLVSSNVLAGSDLDRRLTSHPDGVIPVLVEALRDPHQAAKFASRATALLQSMAPIGLEGSLSLLDVEIELMRLSSPPTNGKKAKRPENGAGRQGSVRGPAWLAVKAYVMRCLMSCDPERVSFFLPQLVQALRSECDPDSDHQIEDFLITAAAKSDIFAHRLLWALETEARPPEEAFNPEIKRSGWEPPKDTGLWSKMDQVKARVVSSMPSPGLAYVQREMQWLEGITSISGRMKKVEPENRKETIANILRAHNEATEAAAVPANQGVLYLPVKPKMKVLRAVPESGAVMQSAAKFPVMVAFEVTPARPDAGNDALGVSSTDGAEEETYIPALLSNHDGSARLIAALVRTARSSMPARNLADYLLGRISCARVKARGVSSMLEPAYEASLRPAGLEELRIQDQLSQLDSQVNHAPSELGRDNGDLGTVRALTSRLGKATSVQACIFKVGDDCRQDVLALQVIAMLRSAFQRSGLDLFLYPYGVVPTGYERGVIEVVPNTKSRSSLGETADGGLLDIFIRQFGAPGTPRFEIARRNFLRSLAGYAVASYLLQSKDRHNGNILVDSQGHLIHIDFGFILEISPGGNLGFETASFKLSHEMTQLVDPGRSKKSENFREFMEMTIQGFLAARGIAEEIIHCVSLMACSGLPCFGYGKPLEHLRERFKLDCTERQAARHMKAIIIDAYDKFTTRGYDVIQRLQQGILS